LAARFGANHFLPKRNGAIQVVGLVACGSQVELGIDAPGKKAGKPVEVRLRFVKDAPVHEQEPKVHQRVVFVWIDVERLAVGLFRTRLVPRCPFEHAEVVPVLGIVICLCAIGLIDLEGLVPPIQARVLVGDGDRNFEIVGIELVGSQRPAFEGAEK
jgi:hypothetical protein